MDHNYKYLQKLTIPKTVTVSGLILGVHLISDNENLNEHKLNRVFKSAVSLDIAVGNIMKIFCDYISYIVNLYSVLGLKLQLNIHP